VDNEYEYVLCICVVVVGDLGAHSRLGVENTEGREVSTRSR
jgi:hypothetical protein